MTGRVIVLGATGFTGRLVAEVACVAGLAPVLAGRHSDALAALLADVAPLAPSGKPPTTQIADVHDTESVRALVTRPDDVLVTTVGPFVRLGRPAVDAAIDAGCGYVDSTGEPTFIREVFESDGARASTTGARLLTAFGYDYVPGNLAGAIAMRDAVAAGRIPDRVEVGYFVKGTGGYSSGTKASMAASIGATPFAYTTGAIVEGFTDVETFAVGGEQCDALPIGGSEHFTLPRLDHRLTSVGVYLGWAGKGTRAAHAAAKAAAAAARVPLAGKVIDAALGRGSDVTGQGPNAHERAQARTVVVARTLDPVGRQLSHVTMEGPSPYDLTAELIVWAAAMVLTGRTTGVGALGPVDGFGLAALESGCADIGLRRVD